MDVATLVTTRTVLEARGIRPAARRLDKAPGTVATALDRVEAELSIALAVRAGAELVLTLEAERLLPDLNRAADLAVGIARLAHGLAEETPEDIVHRAARLPIGLIALSRFVGVVAVGSIRGAAQALGVGQPQLTRQMGQLESAIGRPLLDRLPTGTVPTPAGERLRDLAVALDALWMRLSRNSGARHRSAERTIRLGTVMPLGHESPIARHLAHLAAVWPQKHPRHPLFIQSTTAEELIRGLKTGMFDVALLDTPGTATSRPATNAGKEATEPQNMESIPVSSGTLALVGFAVDRIAASRPRTPFVVPSARSGLRQCINAWLSDVLDDTGRDALDITEVDSIPVILNMVMDHGFMSVLPLSSVTMVAPDLPHMPLAPRYDLPLRLVWHRRPGAEEAGRALAALLRT